MKRIPLLSLLLCSCLPCFAQWQWRLARKPQPSAAPATWQFAQGSYAGNGSDNRAITVGFQPKVVIIFNGSGNGKEVMRFASMAGDLALYPAAGGGGAGLIKSLTTDGFTVGTDLSVNYTGGSITYYWMALAGTNVATGTYTGNGTSQGLTGAGFAPTSAAVISAVAVNQLGVVKSASLGGTNSVGLDGGTGLIASGAISSLDADGLTVGSSAKVNTNGSTYYWWAWKNTSGKSNSGSYTGTGVAHDITGSGFQPTGVYVKIQGAASPCSTTASEPASAATDLSSMGSDTASITALVADGFTVGTDTKTNNGSFSYLWWSFKP